MATGLKVNDAIVYSRGIVFKEDVRRIVGFAEDGRAMLWNDTLGSWSRVGPQDGWIKVGTFKRVLGFLWWKIVPGETAE